MEKMGQHQQQQEMGEFGQQQFVISSHQQQQFGEVMNLQCSSSISGGGSIFQTESGSTICQLGTAAPPPQSQQMDPCLCSPASSASGSQPRLVHLSSGSGANDSGISSGAGSYGGGSVAQPLLGFTGFSPDIRCTEQHDELQPEARDRSKTWHGFDRAGNSQTSPPIHDRIPEEENMYGDDDVVPMDGIGGADAASADGCCGATMTDNSNGGGTSAAVDQRQQHHHLLMLQQQQHNTSSAQHHHYQQQQQHQQIMGGSGIGTVSAGIRRYRRPSSSSSATNGVGPGVGIGSTMMMPSASSALLVGGSGGQQQQQQQQYCGDGTEPMFAESPSSGVDVELSWTDRMSPRPDSAIGDSCSRSDSPPSAAKKATTRRNAWGNMSYADLITQAILNSPEKRLTLSQVYEWMVQNVPYFRDKGDSNSSAGWKNSIRHNLSLHSRFMRIQNEGAGKSSWWVINPDAKPGRNPRRRANTMEAATKAVIDKKRRGARKRVETLVQQKGINGGCSSSMASIIGAHQSAAMFPSGSDDLNDPQHMVINAPPTGPNFDTFRPRAESTLSVVGGPASCSRLSPTNETSSAIENFPFPEWMDKLTQQQHQQNGCIGDGASTDIAGSTMPSCSATVVPTTTAAATSSAQSLMNPQVSELLDRTDQMRLEANVEQSRLLNNGNSSVGLLKMEIGCCAAAVSTASCSSASTTSSSSSSSVLLMPKSEFVGAGGGVNDPSSSFAHVKQEQSSPLSSSSNNTTAHQQTPPSYQELSAVRRPAQMQTNPLLRQLGAMRNAGGGTPSPPQMKIGANINSSTSAMMSAVPSCSSSSSSPNMFSTSSSIVQSSSGSSTSPFSGVGGGGWLPPGASLPPIGCGQQMVPPQHQQLIMMPSSAGMSPLHHNMVNGTMVGIGSLQQQQHQFADIGVSASGPAMAGGGGGATALPSDLENVNVMTMDQCLFSEFAIAELGNGLAGGQFDFSSMGGGGGGGGQEQRME